MKKQRILRRVILAELVAAVSLTALLLRPKTEDFSLLYSSTEEVDRDYIKWVDFQVTAEALRKAYEYDKNTYGSQIHLDWIELLAYVGAHTGGEFSRESTVSDYMDSAAEYLLAGGTMEELAGELQYYDYYLEAYTAVLGGMVGEYRIEEIQKEGEEPVWAWHYGLKAFHPIAKGLWNRGL